MGTSQSTGGTEEHDRKDTTIGAQEGEGPGGLEAKYATPFFFRQGLSLGEPGLLGKMELTITK